LKTSDFFFDLPERLIAQRPPEQRGQSRLMLLDRSSGKREHRMASELPEILLRPEFRGRNGEPPLLVFNDSKVRKARLLGTSAQTGAAVEFVLLNPCDERGGVVWKAIVSRAKRRKTGSRYIFRDDRGGVSAAAEITGEDGEFRIVAFDRVIDDAWLEQHGHIPLPPYIKRGDTPEDSERYQTVYAAASGSAAAPTAGLHFTRELFDRFAAAGIESAFVTLHVGLGTFLPVRSETVEDHTMHEEFFHVGEEAAARIERAKAAGRKVIACGTTSVRVLESAFTADGTLLRGNQRTSIFIKPGYRFKVIDALFTNFHTPCSTLLMLVAAFAGRELVLESYREAIREGYRFFSYGDAMLAW
jgi:S-adenosylmethionine:tRNA ribosyltransferase-isomerase